MILDQCANMKMRNFLTQSVSPVKQRAVTLAHSNSGSPLTIDFQEKRGWLFKKGKRRFFALQKSVLFYFSLEQKEVKKKNSLII